MDNENYAVGDRLRSNHEFNSLVYAPGWPEDIQNKEATVVRMKHKVIKRENISDKFIGLWVARYGVQTTYNLWEFLIKFDDSDNILMVSQFSFNKDQ